MDKSFIGRKQEIDTLKSIMQSGRPEFVTVYGRRRVGKTFLIQQFFDNKFAFATTGIIDGPKKEQFHSFYKSLKKSGYEGKQPENWLEAFDILAATLEKRRSRGRCVIYIDELPCFDTPKAGFVRALGYFWNSWASLRKDVVLIVCGSATSWITDNLINNHAGLHNRLTRSIYLRQFSLSETEKYLKNRGFKWKRLMILDAYMMLGGVPYYLSLLDSRLSLAQNIDHIYFEEGSELSMEYRRLYTSLFKSPEQYVRIIETLAENKQGMTRGEIADALSLPSSGTLTRQLESLVNCDIIRRYVTKAKGKPKMKDTYYQLVDLFTLFHLTFAQKNPSSDFWERNVKTPAVNTWLGLAFEHVCNVHIKQIRHTLGLDRIAVEYYSWRSKMPSRAQVDMVIERADDLIHICEIKYSNAAYVITSEQDMKFRNRMAAFAAGTSTQCGLLPTWITTYGLFANEYSTDVQYQVTMDDLFAE